jgi:hypothetical protein
MIDEVSILNELSPHQSKEHTMKTQTLLAG